MVLDAAERRELVTRQSLRLMLRRLGRSGRSGVGTLRRLLDARSPGRKPTESEMETMLVQVLRRHGFPEPFTQYKIRCAGRFVARVDAAYPEWRIAIEYDSYEYHAGRKAHDRDNARRNKDRGCRLAPGDSDSRGPTSRRTRALRGNSGPPLILASLNLIYPRAATPKSLFALP
jgi:hypothetical protein